MTQLKPVRWSHLKMMGRSAAHYRYHLDHPKPQSDAMRVGSRVHSLVLRGERDRFAIWEGGRRAGKDWDLFALANQDAIILTADQEDRAQSIAQAVLGHDDAMMAIHGCAREVTHTWTIGDRECQGTPDAIGPASVVDLKVTNDASPGRFPWHARRMGWLAQLAWYDYGILKGNAISLALIAVEDQPPHLVTVYKLTPAAAELGHRTWRSHFERLLVCEATDRWPGYVDCPVPLDVDQEFTLHMDGEEIEL